MNREDENEVYHLKLCLCPLCKNGIEVFGNKRPVSWILICRVILYSLMDIHKGTTYFSLKEDIHRFVADHWYIFGKLDQFKTNPNKWKKSFLDGLSHSPYFQSGTMTLKKPNYWKLRRRDCPWMKTKKFYATEEEEEEEFDPNMISTSKDGSPSPDLIEPPSRDRMKDYLTNKIEQSKTNLMNCGRICDSLVAEGNGAMKEVSSSLKYILSALDAISSSIDKTII